MNEDVNDYWVVSAACRGLPKVAAAVVVSLSKYVSCAVVFSGSDLLPWGSDGFDSVTVVLLTFFVLL